MISECDGCVFLLHYEWDIKEKHDLPRCSIEFRDGSKVEQPCKDKISEDVKK